MNKIGIITKSQKELYFVASEEKEYKCKARGVFRDKKIKPLVGDKVKIQVLDEDKAYIEEVFDRKNSLIRPSIANIDQILLVSSLSSPKLNYTILDKYLLMLEHFSIDVKIIINKIELASEDEIDKFKSIYEKTPYKFYFTSVNEGQGVKEVEALLKDKISAFAGPSGVGKSSLLNLFSEDFNAETGMISKKTSRGKHTTRHVELFQLDSSSFIFDTPGFTAIDLSFIEDYKEVKEYFRDFDKFKSACKFSDCSHINEPACAVKRAVEDKLISKERYENYIYISEEIKDKRRYWWKS